MAAIDVLKKHVDNVGALPSESFGAVAEALAELKGTDRLAYETYVDRFVVNSAFNAYLLETWRGDSLADLRRRAERVAAPGAGGDGVREAIVLGGAAGAAFREPRPAEAKPEVPLAAYSMVLAQSGSDQIVLFEGDPLREVRVTFNNERDAAHVYQVLIPVLDERRRGSADYQKKAPANKAEAILELFGDILHLSSKKDNPSEKKSFESILNALFSAYNFHADDERPEVVTTKKEMIANYYAALEVLGALENMHDAFNPPAILKQAEKGRKIFPEFAGQSNEYMDSLAYYYQMPDVRPLIEKLAAAVQKRAQTSEALASGFYSQGLDLIEWLKNPESRPDPSYILSSPISQPLLFITQVANMLYLKNRGFRPTPEMVAGTSGHSQGIMPSVLFAQFLEGQAFDKEAENIAIYLFWQAFRMHEVGDGYYDLSEADARAAGVDLKKETPSPMAFIMGLATSDLQEFIDKVNRTLPQNKHIYISLDNTRTRKIVSAPISSLARLKKLLEDTMAKEQEASKKKKLEKAPLDIQFSWLTTSAPYHSPYMQEAKERILEDMRREHISFSASNFKVAVYHTRYGTDLRQSDDVNRDLVNMQCDALDYNVVSTRMQGTTVVSFGPGDDTLGAIRSNITGTGTAFIAADKPEGRKCLLTSDPKALPKAVDYMAYKSRAVALPGGRVDIDNRYTRYTHRPPVLVGGMTPTTGDVDINVVATNYGYHIELAGGAQGTDKILEQKIDAISEQLNPGEYITINLLYLAPYIWGFLPAVKKKVAEGKPIGGLTIAAGVPVPDEGKKILRELNDILIWNVSLKPGNQQGTDDVCKIAAENPDREIVVQFELGVAGGHHSWETMEILRKNYRKFREHDNIILMVGGGVRNQEDAAKWVDGTWNTEGVPMPMDGVFLGSRLIAVSQAKTSPQVKARVAVSQGIHPAAFLEPGTYGPDSDVITLTAGDGEPIHHSRTFNARFIRWLELNAKPESPKDEARVLEWIMAHKREIIEGLNQTQKPYFVPVDADFKQTEITSMSYEAVLNRLVEMMYFPEAGGWLDFSLRNYVGRFMEFLESKYLRPDKKGNLQSSKLGRVEVWEAKATPPLKHYHGLEKNPAEFISAFIAAYPQLKTGRMDAADVAKFSELSNPGRYRMKPLPFIWQLDASLWQRGVTSDSLFQAHYERFPVEAVLPEPGPAAVAGILEANEDIKEVLDMFHLGIRNRLLVQQLGLQPARTEVKTVETRKPAAESYRIFRDAVRSREENNEIVDVVTLEENPQGISRFEVRYYDLSEKQSARLPRTAYLGGPVLGEPVSQFKGFKRLNQLDEIIMKWEVTDPVAALKPTEKGKGPSEYARFLLDLARQDSGTLTSLLTANLIYQGKTPVNNYLRDIFMPRKGQRWEIWKDGDRIEHIYLHDETQLKGVPVVSLSALMDGTLQVTLNHARPTMDSTGNWATHSQLDLLFKYHPEQGYAPIHEVMEGRSERIAGFYRGLLKSETEATTLTGAQVRRMAGAFGDRIRAVNETAFTYQDTDYEVVLETVEVENSQAGQSRRMKGKITLIGDTNKNRPPLNVWIRPLLGEFFERMFEGNGALTSLLHQTCKFEVLPDGTIATEQQVFFRGNFSGETDQHWRREKMPTQKMQLKSAGDVAGLLARPWFRPVAGVTLARGDELTFKISVDYTFKKDRTKNLSTKGEVFRGTEFVGEIIPVAGDTLTEVGLSQTKQFKNEDPVLAYLKEKALADETVKLTDLPEAIEVTTRAPRNMTAYALASGDLNPLHANPYFMPLAGLKDDATGRPMTEPIVHGMWTYGEMVRLFTKSVADSRPDRVLNFAGSFLSPVPLGAKLTAKFQHVGNKDGNLVYSVQVFKQVKDAAGEDQSILVFEGTATAVPPRTADIFTGQGSARLGMFADWKDSKAAQKVIDGAERYMKKAHGVSIRQVVETGGLKKANKFYVYVDGHKLEAPEGKTILDLTQFQQVALVVYAMAGYAAMRESQAVSGNEIIAGHSLGEYAALSARGILPLETVVELVYQRGKTMQDILSTPAFAGKEFRLYAVKLHYYLTRTDGLDFVSKPIDEKGLESLVEQVSEATGEFIQVVNYNAAGQLYSVAGTKKGLEALKNHLEKNLQKVRGKEGEKGMEEIPGILVPFHSALLLPGVDKFRGIMQAHMPSTIDPQTLAGRYIPNLIAEPFALSRDYVQKIYDYTRKISQTWSKFLEGKDYSSAVLQDLLDHYDSRIQNPGEVARTLVIELLAYQFASPVRWIKTQNALVRGDVGFDPVQRVREIGPQAQLNSMLRMQMRGNHAPFVRPETVHTATPEGRKAILSNEPLPSENGAKGNGQVVEVSKPAQGSAAPSVTPAKPATVAPIPAVPAPAAPVAAVAPVAQPVAPSPSNVPAIVAQATGPVDEVAELSKEDSIRIIIALKTKKSLEEITLDKTIDQLTGGNSTQGNQVVKDLGEEFGLGEGDLSNPKQISLKDLIAAVKGKYDKVGPVMKVAFDEYVLNPLRGKMELKGVLAYLKGERLLPDRRAINVMNWLTLLGRDGFFKAVSAEEAKAKLEEAVNKYAETFGLRIPIKSLMNAGGGGGGGATVSSEALQALERKYFGVEGILSQGFLNFLSLLGIPWQQLMMDRERDRLQELEGMVAELKKPHVTEYARLTRGVFDADKAIDLEWNWGDHVVTDLFARISRGEFVDLAHDLEKLQEWRLQVLRWANKDVLEVLNYMVQKAETDKTVSNGEVVALIFKKLRDDVKAHLEGTYAGETPFLPKAEISAPKTEMADEGTIKFGKRDREDRDGNIVKTWSDFADEIKDSLTDPDAARLGLKPRPPFVSVRKLPTEDNGQGIKADETLSFLALMEKHGHEGFDFRGKVIWLTGASKDSMAESLLKFFLAGGATVVLGHYGSGKRSPEDELERYKSIRRQFGTADSKLHIFWMNQGSQSDIEAMEKEMDARDLVPDVVIPFGAFTPQGSIASTKQGYEAGVEDILQNSVKWMMAGVARLKAKRNPVVVEGDEGGEKLNVGDYVGVAGTRIGWVNTSLMKDLAVLAEAFESEHGVRTFTPMEMAFILANVISPEMTGRMNGRSAFLLPLSPNHGVFGGDIPYGDTKRALEALYNYVKSERSVRDDGADYFVDANGAFDSVPDMAQTLTRIREKLTRKAEEKKAIFEAGESEKALRGEKTKADLRTEEEARQAAVQPDLRRHFMEGLPPEPSEEQLEALAARLGVKDLSHLDLDKIYVVVGMGEFGPYANSRLRWQIESRGEFSVEGAIEMAQLLGIITYKDDREHVGWWDVREGKPIGALAVKEKYEKEMLEKSGIRFVDPAMQGFDPKNIRNFLEGIVEEENGKDIVATDEAQANDIVRRYVAEGVTEASVFKFYDRWSEKWKVHLPKGAKLYVLKGMRLDRYVAGQVPSGFDPKRYGIPQALIDQVDNVTLFNIIAYVESLYSAGTTDMHAMLAHMGITLDRVGDTEGGGLGGGQANAELQLRYKGAQDPGGRKRADVVQELLINVIKAYAQTRISKNFGSNASTVFACATAASSVEVGLMYLETGEADFVTVGGFDDYTEAGGVSFAAMDATASADIVLRHGIPARKHSRANSRRRYGFVEAQGAAVLHLAKASKALQANLPIYAIVGSAISAADGADPSIPAPGPGLMRAVTGPTGEFDLLDIGVRQRLFASSDRVYEKLFEEYAGDLREAHPDWPAEQVSAQAKQAADIAVAELRTLWAHRYRQVEAFIKGTTPLGRALSELGLTVDDIAILYAHDTGTGANDPNEKKLYHTLFNKLGRKAGNKALLVSQKTLTGHSKGGAAGWQMIGAIQTLLSGRVAGNASLDDVDPALSDYSAHILFSDQPIDFGPHQLLAGLLASLGFGHAGVMIYIAHPNLLLLRLSPEERAAYFKGRNTVLEAGYQKWLRFITGKGPYWEINANKPFEGATKEEIAANEMAYILDPSQFEYDSERGLYIRKQKPTPPTGGGNGGGGRPVASADGGDPSAPVLPTPSPIPGVAMEPGTGTAAVDLRAPTVEERVTARGVLMALGYQQTSRPLEYISHDGHVRIRIAIAGDQLVGVDVQHADRVRFRVSKWQTFGHVILVLALRGITISKIEGWKIYAIHDDVEGVISIKGADLMHPAEGSGALIPDWTSLINEAVAAGMRAEAARQPRPTPPPLSARPAPTPAVPPTGHGEPVESMPRADRLGSPDGAGKGSGDGGPTQAMGSDVIIAGGSMGGIDPLPSAPDAIAQGVTYVVVGNTVSVVRPDVAEARRSPVKLVAGVEKPGIRLVGSDPVAETEEDTAGRKDGKGKPKKATAKPGAPVRIAPGVYRAPTGAQLFLLRGGR